MVVTNVLAMPFTSGGASPQANLFTAANETKLHFNNEAKFHNLLARCREFVTTAIGVAVSGNPGWCECQRSPNINQSLASHSLHSHSDKRAHPTVWTKAFTLTFEFRYLLFWPVIYGLGH